MIDKNVFRTKVKKIVSLIISAIFFWVLWFVISNFLAFLEWVYFHHDINFIQFWRYGGMESNWGVIYVLVSFYLSYLIVKKINIKI